MNAFFIILPIFLIRYGLLRCLNIEALNRAGFFAPLIGREKVAYWTYQLTTIGFLLKLLFLKVNISTNFFYIGLIIYSLGIVLYIGSVVDYAKR